MAKYFSQAKLDELGCPNLTPDVYHITSEHDPSYNCFAWAAHITDQYWDAWEGTPNGRTYYWPEGVEKSDTQSLNVYIKAYESFGFRKCHDGTLQAGYEKIALFVDDEGWTLHAARQLPTGSWTSKIGQYEDVEHRTLEALEGQGYGKVMQYMRRRINEQGKSSFLRRILSLIRSTH